jgi:hypothetical protein
MTMPLPYGVPPMPAMGEPFAAGYGSGRGPQSPGLEAQGARWTALGQQAALRPTSVQQQLSPSPIAANLSAPSQRDRLLPNGFELGNTSNGASAGTAQTENYMTLRGTSDV